MKSLFRIFVAISIISVLSGCAPEKVEKNKITVWHWMNDRKEALSELANKYKQNTGINVEFKLFSPPDIYAQKIIAAARAGRLPDIFGILGEKKTLASFIKAGYVLDLSSYMAEENSTWEKSFYPQTLEVVRFRKNNNYDVKQGVYGVPIDTTIMEFLYNKSLFEKSGLEQIPPKNFDEFLEYAQKVKQATGADGFVCGWGEGWLLNALLTEWALNVMGEKKFIKTIKGEVPYTDKEWIEVFSLFSKIKESGILAPNITTMINKEAEDSFAKGNAAFSFNGSWSVNVYKQLSPNLNYAFFPLPKVSDRFPIKIWGGAGSAFMISGKSQNKEKAAKFLKWLTAKQQQKFLAVETNNLPAIKDSSEGLPAILITLTKHLDILTHPNIWPYNENSRVLEVMNKGLQQIVMGIKTPEMVARDIQNVKERTLITK